MPRPSPTLAAGLFDLFVAPGSLFAALPDRRWWGWAAFVLLTVGITASIFTFVSPMSTEWLVEQQIQQMSERMSDAEIERVRPHLVSMAPHTAVFGTLGGVIFTGMAIVLVGSLYTAMTRLAGSGPKHGWGTWLRFTTWTQLPQLVAALGLIVLALVASSPDQPMGLMGYASLNNLLLDLPPGHRWYNLATNLSLFTLWSLVLAAIGMRIWTGASAVRATLLAITPWALVFGIWALIP